MSVAKLSSKDPLTRTAASLVTTIIYIYNFYMCDADFPLLFMRSVMILSCAAEMRNAVCHG